MVDVLKSPENLYTGFVNSLKTLCSNLPAPFNFGEDFTLSEPKNHSEENMLVTVNNRQKDVVLDIAFNSAAITIFFIKYKINPYTLHRGCKVVGGDKAVLTLSIPVGVSQRIVDNTVLFVSELVFDSFDRNKFCS